MPAVVKRDEVERLSRAGRVDGFKPQPSGPSLEELAGKVSGITDMLAGLSQEQLSIVVAMATQAQKQSDVLMTAVAALTQKKETNERWNFEVTQRDSAGRIKSVSAKRIA